MLSSHDKKELITAIPFIDTNYSYMSSEAVMMTDNRELLGFRRTTKERCG